MELEITIKVPLPGAGASAPTPVGGEAVPDEVVHEAPSPAAFGLTTGVASAGVRPPSIEMMEQITATSPMANGPPGLDGFSFEQLSSGQVGAGARPPDFPDLADPSDAPSVSEELAPPPVDRLEPPESGSSRRGRRRGPP